MKKLFVVLVAGAAAVAAAFLLTSGASGTHSVVGDHYLCYAARDVTVPGPPQDPPGVQLQDQFGTVNANPLPADRLCNPAGKDGSTIRDQQTHLKRYRIPGAFAPRNVRVDNQFGIFLLTLTGPKYLLVPTSKNTEQQPNPAAPEFEHYQCYTARRTPRVGDQFGDQGNIVIFNWILCAPAKKVHGTNTFNIKRPGRHLLCYPINITAPTRTVQAVNQFGFEALELTAKREFCVPSTKQVIPPPPS
jgi:hypothetical protein